MKIATITPIFKKEDPKLIENYRPISVLPILSKLFEKSMYNRLKHFIEENLFLSPFQFGFRNRTSTEDAIISG